MIPLHGRNIGPEHIGRIIADGYEIVWVLDRPLIAHGASMHLRHIDTDKWSLLDCGPDDTVWLQTDTIPPARWLHIARTVAEQVTSA